MHDIRTSDNGGNVTLVDRAPTVAGGLPANYRSPFVESSLRDAEWIRLPLPGTRCPLTGLSRTSLLELGERGKIIIKRIRKPGATRGIVILNKRSLLDYLENLTSDSEVTATRNTNALVPA